MFRLSLQEVEFSVKRKGTKKNRVLIIDEEQVVQSKESTKVNQEEY